MVVSRATQAPGPLYVTPMSHPGNPVPVPFRLATWNLRYDVQPDGISVAKSLAALPDPRVAPPPVPSGERPWSARRVRVAQRLDASRVDLVGAFGTDGDKITLDDDNVLCIY